MPKKYVLICLPCICLTNKAIKDTELFVDNTACWHDFNNVEAHTRFLLCHELLVNFTYNQVKIYSHDNANIYGET